MIQLHTHILNCSVCFFRVSVIMANRMIYFALGVFLLICCYSDNVMAGDSDPLQDFCVADEESKGENIILYSCLI